MYNNDYKSYYKRNDVTKIGRDLVQQLISKEGLKQVSEIGDTTGASVILLLMVELTDTIMGK
ncbi:MAG: hypothetical protein ACLTUW_09185 [Lachnospira eligens]